MNETKQIKRIEAIDIAKGICIFAIVLAHIWRAGYERWFVSSFNVPVFFVLSGLTYCFKDDIKGNFIKRFKHLLIPYYVWALISIVIFKLMFSFTRNTFSSVETTSEIVPNILSMLYGNSRNDMMKWNTPLWFLPCMFVTLTLVDVFEKLIFNKNKKCLIRVIFCLTQCFVYKLLCTFFPDLALPFHTECAVLMSVYIEIGVLIKKYFLEKSFFKEVNLRVTLACCVMIFIGGGVKLYQRTYGYTKFKF